MEMAWKNAPDDVSGQAASRLAGQHRPEGATAEKMYVQMVDFLSAVIPAIDDQTKAILGDAFSFG